MNKELLKYKEELIKSGFIVIDGTGKIEDLVTKSEIMESIKNEEAIIEKIEDLMVSNSKKIIGNIRIVKSINSLSENKQTFSNMEIVQFEINEGNNKIKEYININSFATKLQNRGYTLGIKKQEEEEESKMDRLVNKINNISPFMGYKIVIAQKNRVTEENKERVNHIR